MKFIGLNLDKTSDGKQLRDGGAALILGADIECVVLEERVSRIKRSGGYAKAILTLQHTAEIDLNSVDAIGVSTCCEGIPSPSRIHEDFQVSIVPVNHHISHAIGTFALSPFEESLVVVMDAGGNTLDESIVPWWQQRREQNSYFKVTRAAIELIGRDFDQPANAGFGEIYRAFTYYLGFGSSQHAGKTMALAAYGDAEKFADMPIFGFSNDGTLCSYITNDPENPLMMVQTLLEKYGIKIAPRESGEPFTDKHASLAAWVQSEIEKALRLKLEWLINHTKINNVCLSGGVAYNCKMNGEIARYFGPSRIFVQPASGDHGQCLGNAIYTKYLATKKIDRIDFNPYLGPRHSKVDILELLSENPELSLVTTDNITKYTANLLAKGKFVCRYHGRSEFGPRALGNRSILADPRNIKNKFAMNMLKSRDPFMPFAPSVLQERAQEYFLNVSNENYMTTAVKADWKQRNRIPAVIHKDGTSRIHLVNRSCNPEYYDLIDEFYNISHVPMVLNTSFNRAKEPIVESPADAILCFKEMEIDYLLIDGHLIEKKEKCQFIDTYCDPGEGYIANLPSRANAAEIEKYTGVKICSRDKFNLYHEFINWLHYGRKVTTIRYKHQAIDFPISDVLPMYETQDFSLNAISDRYVGHAEIKSIIIKKYGQLTNTDALNDGFSKLEDLLDTLRNIYKGINDESYVTIYHIYLNTHP